MQQSACGLGQGEQIKAKIGSRSPTIGSQCSGPKRLLQNLSKGLRCLRLEYSML